MYLTIRQHDAFRNLLMGFEIPFRAYIAEKITGIYKTDVDFEIAMKAKYSLINPSSPKILRNTNKKSTTEHFKEMYCLFEAAKNSVSDIVSSDIEIPFVGALIIVTSALTEDFKDLYGLFSSYSAYYDLAEKYRYARNKLDHPGCRTLEEVHLLPVLSFVKDICQYLDAQYFLQKPKQLIIAEVIALQQRKLVIPVAKHNFGEMPFSESKLVCRDNEINRLKEFIYGKPNSLRKQHACCIYGFGGVGKTALVLETLKQVVGDILDNTTINEYMPSYIFFYSAKKRKLGYASETGRLMEQQIRFHFESAQELIALILNSLGVTSLRGFRDEGLIIIDNLETLSMEERIKVKQFVDTQTPESMQFILTSRNSEEYEVPFRLSGFEGDSGKEFINAYNEENALDLNLTDPETIDLLSLCKGNTLVLVLSLRRLSEQLTSVSSLKSEFSSRNAWKNLRISLSSIPSGAFEVIAEFMYKDTFEHIESTFAENVGIFHNVLKIFAIIDNGSTDINTICLLTQESYPDVEAVIDVLCGYLIIEKNDTEYSLNSFAEKYIVGRFMPDSERYNQLSADIANRQRQVRNELAQMENDISTNEKLASIMLDWQIHSDIDRITAARMYRLYQDVNRECRFGGARKIGWAIEEFENRCEEIERMTAHPFVKYEKARIYQIVDRSQILTERHEKEIVKAYNDCIYSIRTIEQYLGIMETKSYASLLWLFGQYLCDIGEIQNAIRYLEESKESFESQGLQDVQYYQCLSKLGAAYLDYYTQDRNNRKAYLRNARSINTYLKQHKDCLGKAKKYALELRERLGTYGQYNE